MTYERYKEILDDLIDELPDDIFDGLNLGVVVSDTLKEHPESRNHDLFIMGEYQQMGIMGKRIMLFYRSFERFYSYHSEERQIKELRKILRHELKHHWEFRAGERGLVIADMESIARYLSSVE